ncbi:hypothetical protein ElyMa_000255300 [Elysia marginata]|uniref:Uncharacterized protein n=1 Tax=Elysia marginata TaxID=1093978 RepID=A0AAV4F2S6_9GAST|nr:hypothetical protein ElyMa_000255300 [Elysia marginata]
MVHVKRTILQSRAWKMEQTQKDFQSHLSKTLKLGMILIPIYRSPNHGGQELVLDRTTNTIKIDNRWVVPYNPLLLRLMNCHLNVELCSSVKSIKYVLKYFHKGCDQATFKVTEQATRDEVSEFINARYIGSTEAAWRIFCMPMHERFPPVMQLAVHLENGQRVYFTEENAHEKSVSDAPDSKTWTQRKRGTKVEGHDIYEVPVIGRIYTVSPRQGECFFLRLLLHHVRGPKGFEDFKRVEDHLCQS